MAIMYMYVCMHVHMYLRTYVCIYVYVYVCMYVCVCMCVCIYGPVHVGGNSRLPAPLPPGCSHSHPTNSCSCLLYPVYEHPKTRHNTLGMYSNRDMFC